MSVILARRYDTDEAIRVEISADGDSADGVVATVAPWEQGRSRQSVPAQLPLIAPGLFDLQVNGHGGKEFSSAGLTVNDVLAVAGRLASDGVARFLPTITTAAADVMEHGLAIIAATMEDQAPLNAARIEGIHLEGPFLSSKDGPRGAHPREHCTPPAVELFDRLQAAAGGNIRLLTMAVEFDNAPEFIRHVTQSGVIVAIGHTAATGEQVRAAVDAGATLSTHLGNGAHPILPRHPNYIWHQLAEDRLFASLIADGFHLPPEVLKSLVRGKGIDRCILVSDLSGYAGMPPGRYQTSLCELELLESGKIVLAENRDLLAAASKPLIEGVANIARFTDATLSQAIDIASLAPARLLGEATRFLEPGSPADFTLLDASDEGLCVNATIVGGQLVHGSLQRGC